MDNFMESRRGNTNKLRQFFRQRNIVESIIGMFNSLNFYYDVKTSIGTVIISATDKNSHCNGFSCKLEISHCLKITVSFICGYTNGHKIPQEWHVGRNLQFVNFSSFIYIKKFLPLHNILSEI
jgi:hypothetical protein